MGDTVYSIIKRSRTRKCTCTAMDSDQIPLEDLLGNFDPTAFLQSDDNIPSPFSEGMKSLEDPMTTCPFADEAQFMPTESVSESSSVYQHNLPCTSEMVGNYNFQIDLGSQPKRVANPDWVFKNDKLYIKSSILCPIVLSASPSLPPSCSIKIMPIFKNQPHIREIVRCCANHTVMDANTNGFSSVAHFIRCDNEKVTYKECPITGRFYLTVPFIPSQQDPTTKSLSAHELFSFICNNSCVGLNRRAIQIIFEITQGQTILGRRLIEVRVCACPGRDSKNDDTQKPPFRRKRRLQTTTEEPLYLHTEETDPYQSSPTTKLTEDFNGPARKKSTEDHFYLKINGRQNFVIMERIAKALELFTSMEKRFFSKNFPFQALEQMERSNQNECPEYAEPDSTLYRQNSCQDSSTFVDSSPPLSPVNGMSNWEDNVRQYAQAHSNTSQSNSPSYQSHPVRRTSLVN